jgi:streptogramin lyase
MTFAPKYPGIRYGAAVLQDNEGNALASGLGYGTGSGSEATFVPGTQSTVDTNLSFPFGIAVDSQGNVFVAARNSTYLYKETPAGGAYARSTISSDLNGPGGVAVDGAGNLYVAEVNMGDIRKETLSNGSYSETTIVSGLNNLDGIAVDETGNLYTVSYDNNLAYKETLQANGSYVQTLFGSGFAGPTGVAVDGSGNVYVSKPTAATSRPRLSAAWSRPRAWWWITTETSTSALPGRKRSIRKRCKGTAPTSSQPLPAG